MPGGVGRVSESILAASLSKDRTILAAGSANEIFYHLHASRVYFDNAGQYLYFVDSPGDRVIDTLRAAMSGLQDGLKIEQLHLDSHRFFNAARRVRFKSRQQAETVLIALRLAGVAVTLSQAST